MKKIKIGKSDLMTSQFVLGGNVFGWTADQKESFKILDTFVGEGFQLIDTANNYSYWAPGNTGGESERVIGNWLKERGGRDKVILATKVGATMTDGKQCLKADYIRQQIENSLRQLQTDYIDIYYSHYDDLNTPIEETLSTYADLVKEGKIRYIAVSNMEPERIKESLALSRKMGYPQYIALQPEYNMIRRKRYETDYQPLVEEYELGVMPFFALASGLLTGKYRTVEEVKSSPRGDLMHSFGYNMDERVGKILKTLHAVADEMKATPAQIALAWMLSNSTITAPIASVSKVEQLDILKFVGTKLCDQMVAQLNSASEY